MSRVAKLHDWTGEPMANRLRQAKQLRLGAIAPLTEPDFIDEVERLSTPDERRRAGERLMRLRRAS